VTGLAAFDEAAYLALNPDVAAAVARGETTALAHYETFGFDEQRMPFFDEQGYLAANPDVAAHVAAGGGSALDHWVQFGQYEDRSLASRRSTAGGLRRGGLSRGQSRRSRRPSPTARWIPRSATGSATARRGPRLLRRAGLSRPEPGRRGSGRRGRRIGDRSLERLRPVRGPAGHHRAGDAFDQASYLANNPDVAEAVAAGHITAEAHYENFGAAEGRAA
jgi:hypothetical protein